MHQPLPQLRLAEAGHGRQSLNADITFGALLGDHQAVQWMIADSQIEIHAARMMILQAAWKLDQGQPIRHEASMTKVFTSEIGMTKAMRYKESPGPFQPCVPYTKGDPAWAAHA